MFKRGEIYYIDAFPVIGCEQRPGRPAVIVLNDINNDHSQTVEVVYLTSKSKPNIPTHIAIGAGTQRESTALCEQITTVDINRVGDYYGRCTDEELAELNKAAMISLSLCEIRKTENETDEVTKLRKKIDEASWKRDYLQNMCRWLIDEKKIDCFFLIKLRER